jgi:hypothetical protein
MTVHRPAFVSFFAPTFPYGRSSHNLGIPVTCATIPTPRSSHAAAVEAAKRGDFSAAARSLRIAPEVFADRTLRRKASRDILNEITLDKLSVESDGGIVELYDSMKTAGLLSSYGSYRGFGRTSADKSVSVKALVARAGVPVTALSPKRSNILLWQVAGVAVVAAITSSCRAAGIDPGPPILLLGACFAVDQLLLRGAIAETVYGRWTAPRICMHEAGHLLCGYLLGLSISGYSLSSRESLRARLPANVSSGGTMVWWTVSLAVLLILVPLLGV